MKQLNLFDEHEFIDSSKKNEIQISIKSSTILSSEQKKFNKLSKKIAELESEIVMVEDNLQKLLNVFVNEISPTEEKEARVNIEASFMLDNLSSTFKFSKKTKNQICDLVVFMLDSAFEIVIPNQEEIELYDRYNEITFEEEKNYQLNDLKSQLEEMYYNQFNMIVDLSDLNVEDPVEVAQFHQKIQEKIQENHNSKGEKIRSSKKKKTHKQIEQEKLEKSKAEAQKKDLKSIYLSLTKALHPDTETDPLLKLEKEELMKRVTFAYQNKDFPQLLRLELEWVHKTSDRLNELSEEQLKIYNAMLKDRVNELKIKFQETLWNPRFAKVKEYAHLSEKSALSQILKEKNEINERMSLLKKNLTVISSSKDKKEFSNNLDFMHDILIPLDIDWIF
jgi:hypothetical protein